MSFAMQNYYKYFNVASDMLIFLTNVSFLLKIGLLNHHYVVVINPFIVDFIISSAKEQKLSYIFA